MSLGLGHPTMPGVDEDNCHIEGRSPSCHIARVLLMSGAIGNDEFSFCGRKITVGNIDCDALLTFGFEAIG